MQMRKFCYTQMSAKIRDLLGIHPEFLPGADIIEAV